MKTNFKKCWNHHCSHGICSPQNHINFISFFTFSFREGLGEKIIEMCCPFRPPWTHRSPWAGSKQNDPPTSRNRKFKGTLAPWKMTIGNWMTTFPFRMIAFSGLNCWTLGGVLSGKWIQLYQQHLLLAWFPSMFARSHQIIPVRSKQKNILHSSCFLPCLQHTSLNYLNQTFEYLRMNPKTQKSQQGPKAPRQGGTTSALLEKVVLKHLASMETTKKHTSSQENKLKSLGFLQFFRVGCVLIFSFLLQNRIHSPWFNSPSFLLPLETNWSKL